MTMSSHPFGPDLISFQWIIAVDFCTALPVMPMKSGLHFVSRVTNIYVYAAKFCQALNDQRWALHTAGWSMVHQITNEKTFICGDVLSLCCEESIYTCSHWQCQPGLEEQSQSWTWRTLHCVCLLSCSEPDSIQWLRSCPNLKTPKDK